MDNVYESIEHRMYDEHGDEIYKCCNKEIEIYTNYIDFGLKQALCKDMSELGYDLYQTSYTAQKKHLFVFRQSNRRLMKISIA